MFVGRKSIFVVCMFYLCSDYVAADTRISRFLHMENSLNQIQLLCYYGCATVNDSIECRSILSDMNIEGKNLTGSLLSDEICDSLQIPSTVADRDDETSDTITLSREELYWTHTGLFIFRILWCDSCAREINYDSAEALPCIWNKRFLMKESALNFTAEEIDDPLFCSFYLEQVSKQDGNFSNGSIRSVNADSDSIVGMVSKVILLVIIIWAVLCSYRAYQVYYKIRHDSDPSNDENEDESE